METRKRHETDTPLASKKFLAYLIAEFTWKAIVVLLILNSGAINGKLGGKISDNILILTIVLIAGFLEVAFILGQVYIDRYMHLADMAMEKVESAASVVTTTDKQIVTENMTTDVQSIMSNDKPMAIVKHVRKRNVVTVPAPPVAPVAPVDSKS